MPMVLQVRRAHLRVTVQIESHRFSPGHEIVADIAQMHLFPSTMTALSSILPKYAKGHLGPVAAWADKIKYANRWSSALHYVNGIGDHPGNRCVFGEQGWEGKSGINVLGGIRNTTDWLMEGKPGAEEALKFLVHFMGDLHMPLHLTGRAKGGNDSKIAHSSGNDVALNMSKSSRPMEQTSV